MKTNSTIKLRNCVTVFAMTYQACISCSVNSEARENDKAERTQSTIGTQQEPAAALPTVLPLTGKKKIKIALLLDSSCV